MQRPHRTTQLGPRLLFRVVPWAVILVLVLQQAAAQETALADLDQIVQQAQTIVRGHILSVRTEPHPQFANLRTVVVTFQIERVLKGATDTTLTFRQYVWGAGAGDALKVSGYGRADELLLFLNPVSRYGLTSPVGLDQGRFQIERDAQGNASAMNGRGNAGLFNQVETKARARGTTLSPRVQAMMRTPTAGKVSLETLEESVLTLMQGQR